MPLLLTGLFKHGSSNGGLIAFYVNMGNIETARKVFDVLPQRGIDAWNAMIIVWDVKKIYRRGFGFVTFANNSSAAWVA